MDQPALCDYIGSHLAHVLDQMLTAASTWACCHPDNGEQLPVDLVVMAEYSAFVHERCLYELVGEPKRGAHAFRRAALESPTRIRSALHERWYRQLCTAVAHVYDRGRAAPPVKDGEHLKNQVAALAADLFQTFRTFVPRMSATAGTAMREALDNAQGKSDLVARSLRAPLIDWSAADPFATWGDHKWWPQ